MDAILDLPADLPEHDAAPLHPVRSKIIAEWPTGTFVENICPLADGSFAISVLSEAREGVPLWQQRPYLDGTVAILGYVLFPLIVFRPAWCGRYA